MDAQDIHNLQEAYMEVYIQEEVDLWVSELVEEGYDIYEYTDEELLEAFLDEAGATSIRLADLARKIINKTMDFSVLPQGKPSLSVLSNLERNARQRANNQYPQYSDIRRGEGGRGVPPRSGDPVRISPQERGRITSSEINRRSFEKDANRNVPLTRREVPIPIRSRPTPPINRPTSRTNTPLTPKIRDQRAAAAGFSGQGSLPKGPKLARQTERGVTSGDNPFDVMRSAATPTKPLPKPKAQSKPKPTSRGSRGGGSSSLPNLGSPSGTTGRYQVGGSPSFGIAGIKLADEYDFYDIILSHLLDEGYADTQQAAEVIMVNMSEEWRESIIG